MSDNDADADARALLAERLDAVRRAVAWAGRVYGVDARHVEALRYGDAPAPAESADAAALREMFNDLTYRQLHALNFTLLPPRDIADLYRLC